MHIVTSSTLERLSKTLKSFRSFFSAILSLLQQLEWRLLLENRMNQPTKNFKLVTSLNPFTPSASLQTGFLNMYFPNTQASLALGKKCLYKTLFQVWDGLVRSTEERQGKNIQEHPACLSLIF